MFARAWSVSVKAPMIRLLAATALIFPVLIRQTTQRQRNSVRPAPDILGVPQLHAGRGRVRSAATRIVVDVRRERMPRVPYAVAYRSRHVRLKTCGHHQKVPGRLGYVDVLRSIVGVSGICHLHQRDWVASRCKLKRAALPRTVAGSGVSVIVDIVAR